MNSNWGNGQTKGIAKVLASKMCKGKDVKGNSKCKREFGTCRGTRNQGNFKKV